MIVWIFMFFLLVLFRFVLEEWMRQSGAVYERLDPKFFRFFFLSFSVFFF